MRTLQMTAAVETITPELAAQFLARSRGNRAYRKRRLDKYCRSRINGHWLLTHQGLAFDWNEAFIDGHHRCRMVIDTGLATPFLVVRGIDPEAAKYIDQGLPRGMADALAMAGIGNYTNDLLVVSRYFPIAPSMVSYDPDVDDVLKTLDEHAEAIHFSCSELKSHSVGISRAVKTLLARAWYHCESERLREWASILLTGQVSHPREDSSAVTYRNFLIQSSRNAGVSVEEERYRKGQTALAAFVRRESLSKVYGTEKDLFPIETVA